MFGPHAGFIIASYAVFFGALALLIAAILIRGARTRRRLNQLTERMDKLS